MSQVKDSLGRTHIFSRIRFKMDELLLQQAAVDVTDDDGERAQAIFDRYQSLHCEKYGRIYDPSHFGTHGPLQRFAALYMSRPQSIRISVEVSSGDLFTRFVGAPITEIEAAVRRDPGSWIRAGKVTALANC